VAACVNITDVESVFEWKGKLEKRGEKILVIKTLQSRFDDLERLVKTNHSYECPEILAFEVSAVSSDYENWVRQACSRM
jgi:periplasmic divalent cation tolerance protein